MAATYSIYFSEPAIRFQLDRGYGASSAALWLIHTYDVDATQVNSTVESRQRHRCELVLIDDSLQLSWLVCSHLRRRRHLTVSDCWRQLSRESRVGVLGTCELTFNDTIWWWTVAAWVRIVSVTEHHQSCVSSTVRLSAPSLSSRIHHWARYWESWSSRHEATSNVNSTSTSSSQTTSSTDSPTETTIDNHPSIAVN